MTRYASALSDNPSAVEAVGEVSGLVLEELGAVPELAVLFVTPPHRDAVDDIADVVRSVLQPVTCSARPRWPSPAQPGGRRNTWHLAVRRPTWLTGGPRPPPRRADAEGWQISGFPTDVAGARSLLLVADPFTFPVDALLDELARTQPGLAVVGGMASAANAPGGTGCSSTSRRTPTGRSGCCSPRTFPRKPSCHRAAGRSGAPTSSPAPTAT